MNQKTNDTVMPSLFASLKSTESMPLASREALEHLITKAPLVSSLTMAYRKRMAQQELCRRAKAPRSCHLCLTAV